jgi:hypothetical protein
MAGWQRFLLKRFGWRCWRFRAGRHPGMCAAACRTYRRVGAGKREFSRENNQIVLRRIAFYVSRMRLRYFVALAVLGMVAMAATAQTSSIAGTWVLTAADKLLPDGPRVADYGSSPHGLIVFTSDGYYSIQIYRADREKFASGR